VAESWTTLRVLDWTTSRFQRAGIEPARLEAQVLLAHTLACDRVRLYTNFDRPLHPDELAAYRQLIQRRLAGEPMAYLTGEQEFWSLSFRVTPDVLIPRRDTEIAIEVVLDAVPDRAAPLRIADVATGSGALAVTLARELGQAAVVATDVSEAAARVARDNAERLGVADRIEVRLGDLLAPLRGEVFDVLVSNPPYVRTPDIAGLAPEVRCEPRLALDGGADGLACLRRIVAGAAAHLAPGGLLALEHGFDQDAAVRQLIDVTGAFAPAQTRRDLGGHPRVTHAVRSPDGSPGRDT
jgi:release factor glutamine methyltransferase